MNAREQHTPGPWEELDVFDDVDQRCRRVIAVQCRCHACLASLRIGGTGVHGGGHVAVLSEWGGGVEAEVAANARLIAAAPDMLAACERALAFVLSMPDNDNVGLALALRAAIARARGVQS